MPAETRGIEREGFDLICRASVTGLRMRTMFLRSGGKQRRRNFAFTQMERNELCQRWPFFLLYFVFFGLEETSPWNRELKTFIGRTRYAGVPFKTC